MAPGSPSGTSLAPYPLTHGTQKTVGGGDLSHLGAGSSSFAVKRLQKSTPRRTCVVSPSGRGVGPPGAPTSGGAPSSARPPQERRGGRPPPTLPPRSSGWWEQRPRETPPCSLKKAGRPPLAAAPWVGARHDHQLHETGDRGFPCLQPRAGQPHHPPWRGPRPPGPASTASDPRPAQGCLQGETWGDPQCPGSGDWQRAVTPQGPGTTSPPTHDLTPLKRLAFLSLFVFANFSRRTQTKAKLLLDLREEDADLPDTSHTYTLCPDGLPPCLLRSPGAGSREKARAQASPSALGRRPAAVSFARHTSSAATDTAQTQGHGQGPQILHAFSSPCFCSVLFLKNLPVPVVGKARVPHFLGPPCSGRGQTALGRHGPLLLLGQEGATAEVERRAGVRREAGCGLWSPLGLPRGPRCRRATEGLVKWEPG